MSKYHSHVNIGKLAVNEIVISDQQDCLISRHSYLECNNTHLIQHTVKNWPYVHNTDRDDINWPGSDNTSNCPWPLSPINCWPKTPIKLSIGSWWWPWLTFSRECWPWPWLPFSREWGQLAMTLTDLQQGIIATGRDHDWPSAGNDNSWPWPWLTFNREWWQLAMTFTALY